MNDKYAGSVVRHAITVIAGAVMASDPQSFQDIFQTLLINIVDGDTNAIVGSSIAIFALLWSMWNKTEEKTKASVVNTLTFKKEKGK
jgi:Na+/serine symporter